MFRVLCFSERTAAHGVSKKGSQVVRLQAFEHQDPEGLDYRVGLGFRV